MNRTKYQVVLDALDKASGVIGKASSKARSIAGRTFSFTVKVIDKAMAPLKAIWNFATSIQGAILGASGAFAGIYKPMDIAGDFEQTQIAFATMLKSADKADKFMKEASDFANKTPFEFPELINSSKLLLAFGFDAKDVLNTLSTIGDAASGLGAGSEGIDRITRALGQMKAKGRVQAEELLQLQEMGIPANQILQEELGLTANQVANIGKEGIESGKAIDALLRGMDKRYGGMMQNQSKTAKGMISTLSDTFKNGLLRPWGQGLWEGIKPGLEKVTTWLDKNSETVAAWGEAWEKAGADISKWVMSRIENLQSRIRKMTNSQEWKDAQTFGAKMKISWDKIIAEPFSQWWNSTGKAWLSEKASKIGEGIGSGITTGLLALLGIDVSATVQEGKSVGGAFIKGFTEGFDTEKITEALKTWADKNKEIVATLGVIIGGKLISGIYKGVKEANKLFTKIKNIFGKGSKDGTPAGAGEPSAYSTNTMTVTASVVYVYGKAIQTPTGGSPGGGALEGAIPTILPPIGIPPLLPSGGGSPSLPLGQPALALPGATGAAGTAGGLGSGYIITAPTTAAGTDIVLGTTSNALIAGLAKTGIALGSGASTVGGAAAAGTAGIAGIIGGILGLGSAGIDVYQGTKASKAGNGKVAKDEYVTAGTKAGMVGSGALIGTAIMPGLGTTIGAGVGGAAALFGGDKAGKALSDATDEKGSIKKWWDGTSEAVGGFFTETLPTFFTESIPGAASKAGSAIAEFVTNTGDTIGGFFSDTLPTFLTEQVPYAAGYAAGAIETFFTETLPQGWDSMWNSVGTFFTESIPTWFGDISTSIGDWWTGTMIPGWNGLWSSVGGFFTETVPTWAADIWNNNIVPFFTQSIPGFFGGLWIGVTTFFTQTLPTWAANIWGNNISPFFTQTIPGFFGSLWSSISGFFAQTLPTLAANIWGSIKSFFTDTIPSFFSGLWGKVKGSFGAGYKAGKGSSVQAHAYGGIMTKPHMGIVAEDGAEGIIPLSPSKRGRAIDLWQRTGKLLGVQPYEDGGIVGDEPDNTPMAAPGNKDGQNITIKVEVKTEPKFIIEGNGNATDENKIIAILKAHIREMADDIGDELAERLARIYANMPVKGGA